MDSEKVQWTVVHEKSKHVFVNASKCVSQKNLYHHKKQINPNTQLFDLDSFLLFPPPLFLFSLCLARSLQGQSWRDNPDQLI